MIKTQHNKKYMKLLQDQHFYRFYKLFYIYEGFNATIMAYGQTGTGKTYSMEGFKYN